jgi:hypothetical protein
MLWSKEPANSERRLVQTHETVSSFRRVDVGSDRKFGTIFGLVFGILGLWPLFHHRSPHSWLIVLAGLFLTAALIFPRSLSLLNRAWFRLGILLNRIVSPVVMGGLFFGAVVPVGWYLRKRGNDLLRLKFDREAPTYWIERNPPGPAPGSLTKQF